MVVYTDSIRYAQHILPQTAGRWSSASSDSSVGTPDLGKALFDRRSVYSTDLAADLLWSHLFIVESAPRSQYDLLIELNRTGTTLPDGILCVAGKGSKFHGLKNRRWTASSGNLHVSINLAPTRRIAHFGPGFMILAAVSVIDAIGSI